MLSLFAEFATDFESSIAIILQQLFASRSVIFTLPYANNCQVEEEVGNPYRIDSFGE